MYLDPSSSLAIEDDFDDEEAWGAVKKQAGTGTEIKKKIMEDDSDDDDDDDDSDVTISDIFPLVTSTPPAHMKGGRRQWNTEAGGSGADGLMASTPPTSALVTKLFPQMKPKQKVTVSTLKYLKLFLMTKGTVTLNQASCNFRCAFGPAVGQAARSST